MIDERLDALLVTEEQLARALPNVMSQEECEAIYGPGNDPLDIAEEWYETPRLMAAAIFANLRETQS